ncbi:MAG: hypothetical protein COC23_07755 [Hyphomicrobiales bacterium]|nr:MAG: hypothetical protein COC23_07755 [Hyphomicrobiales bacterium]
MSVCSKNACFNRIWSKLQGMSNLRGNYDFCHKVATPIKAKPVRPIAAIALGRWSQEHFDS